LVWAREFLKFNYICNMENKSKGLGDTIEKITTATGVKAVVEKVAKAAGKDCGCSARRDALNRAFPYDKNK
jgi:hypothetical protein